MTKIHDDEFTNSILTRVIKKKGLKEYNRFLYKQAVKTFFDYCEDENGNVKTTAECMIHVIDFLKKNNIPKADVVAHKLMDDWEKFSADAFGELLNEQNGLLVYDEKTQRVKLRQ